MMARKHGENNSLQHSKYCLAMCYSYVRTHETKIDSTWLHFLYSTSAHQQFLNSINSSPIPIFYNQSVLYSEHFDTNGVWNKHYAIT